MRDPRVGDTERRRPAPRASKPAIWLALTAAVLPAPALAWTYAEHRAITARGIEVLDPPHRQALDALWANAREGNASRLCADLAAGEQGAKPSCIDLAAWPAIAGDHSCSPKELLQTVLTSDWILEIVAITERAGRRIAGAKNESQRRNALTSLDIGLERADREYSTRAGANTAHFLLPRSTDDPKKYAAEVIRMGAEPNAIAVYLLHHVAALRRAAGLAQGEVSAEARTAAAREVLAIEAFGIHFLEDAFAAGHIAGSWGKTAERKGTHDYYNEHGLDTEDWNHESMLLLGDAHLRQSDLERAGEAVRRSLSQVLDALKAGSPAERGLSDATIPPDALAGTFDTCKVTAMPDMRVSQSFAPYVGTVVLATPIPFRGEGYAALPRFRAEIGPFVGIASGVSGSGAGGGFTEGSEGGTQSSLDVGVRLGVGLDALLGDAGDGLMYLQVGIVNQAKASGSCQPDCPMDPVLQQFVPGVPARSGLQFRLRLPYWLLPGDLILAAPVLAFTSPRTLEKMGITAADGGLIPWQAKIATPIGPIQFVIGREVSATLFGYDTKDAYLATFDTPEGRRFEPVAVKSIQWEFPVDEYHPFREYGTRYAFAAIVQIGAGFDRPLEVENVLRPEQPSPPLKTRYFGFIRLFFDGRRYF